MADKIWAAAVWTSLSPITGIPSGRCLPPGFGICFRRISFALYRFSFRAVANWQTFPVSSPSKTFQSTSSTLGDAFRFIAGKHSKRFFSFNRLYRFPNLCFGSSFALLAIPRSEVRIYLSACLICICFLYRLHNTVIPFPM